MRSLVFVTQEVDPAHPALAATIPKIAALSKRVDRVAVLAAGEVPGVLPDNCVVHTFGASTKAERGLRFTRALGTELVRARPFAVVAHMCPIYAVLAAPLVRPLRVPLVLWFTHWKASRLLRAAVEEVEPGLPALGRQLRIVAAPDRRFAIAPAETPPNLLIDPYVVRAFSLNSLTKRLRVVGLSEDVCNEVTTRGNAYYDAAWAEYEEIHSEEHPRRYFDRLATAGG